MKTSLKLVERSRGSFVVSSRNFSSVVRRKVTRFMTRSNFIEYCFPSQFPNQILKLIQLSFFASTCSTHPKKNVKRASGNLFTNNSIMNSTFFFKQQVSKWEENSVIYYRLMGDDETWMKRTLSFQHILCAWLLCVELRLSIARSVEENS